MVDYSKWEFIEISSSEGDESDSDFDPPDGPDTPGKRPEVVRDSASLGSAKVTVLDKPQRVTIPGAQRGDDLISCEDTTKFLGTNGKAINERGIAQADADLIRSNWSRNGGSFQADKIFSISYFWSQNREDVTVRFALPEPYQPSPCSNHDRMINKFKPTFPVLTETELSIPELFRETLKWTYRIESLKQTDDDCIDWCFEHRKIAVVESGSRPSCSFNPQSDARSSNINAARGIVEKNAATTLNSSFNFKTDDLSDSKQKVQKLFRDEEVGTFNSYQVCSSDRSGAATGSALHDYENERLRLNDDYVVRDQGAVNTKTVKYLSLTVRKFSLIRGSTLWWRAPFKGHTEIPLEEMSKESEFRDAFPDRPKRSVERTKKWADALKEAQKQFVDKIKNKRSLKASSIEGSGFASGRGLVSQSQRTENPTNITVCPLAD